MGLNLDPKPFTSDVPITMVSSPRCVVAWWVTGEGWAGRCAAGSKWSGDLKFVLLSAACRAAAPISTTGIGRDNGRDGGCWGSWGCSGVDTPWCLCWPIAAVDFVDRALFCWMVAGAWLPWTGWPRCFLWAMMVKSSGNSLSRASSSESVIPIQSERNLLYFLRESLPYQLPEMQLYPAPYLQCCLCIYGCHWDAICPVLICRFRSSTFVSRIFVTYRSFSIYLIPSSTVPAGAVDLCAYVYTVQLDVSS